MSDEEYEIQFEDLGLEVINEVDSDNIDGNDVIPEIDNLYF